TSACRRTRVSSRKSSSWPGSRTTSATCARRVWRPMASYGFASTTARSTTLRRMSPPPAGRSSPSSARCSVWTSSGQATSSQATERRQLVTEVGLEHLRAVRADRESDSVAPERVEDPAELVPAGDDLGVQVRGRADLEHDAAFLEHGHRARVVGGLDAVPDAV